MSDLLQEIRDLQHSDKSRAEALLLSFIEQTIPLDVTALELTPLAVSLNSFNGFLTLADGTRRFFKTHTETDTVIDEYYNAEMLHQAGYPVIQPVYKSTEPGKQLLIYDVISDQSVFDVAWELELQHGSATFTALKGAQNRADDDLMRFYRKSLVMQSAADAARSPIHQLFYHRLTGGRLDRFYGANTSVMLPHDDVSLVEVRRKRWQINGQAYTDTLDDIIARAIELLNPTQAGAAIIGHGDAHNGNVFFRRADDPPSLLYFDPAFAGTHHPLLDLTKPLFHNVFAMWMYYPQIKRDQTAIQITTDDDVWQVTYDYTLPDARHMFLQSKIERVLLPTLQLLRDHDLLRPDWRTYLKAALFCCPFLTMNLADNDRFPPEISLLGLVMAVEMGAESVGQRSFIDRTLDDVAMRL